ncbi:MAG: S1 RNA-binding domain-containing protein [bacterium]|nr:S1 RNA-binding domain-containing protein [bacterium]
MPIPTASKKLSAVAQLVKNEPELLSVIREGEVVSAKLIKKMRRAAYFDLGRAGTGVIYGLEFMNAKETLKKLAVDEEVHAKIVGLDDGNGNIELSLAEADKQKAWQTVKDLKESGEVVKVKIGAANSGGLIAELSDLKAFLPVSQLSNEHYPRVTDNDREKIQEELKKFVGQELSVKVIDVNARTMKLIISEREITDENVKELLAKYEVGQVVDGIISGVANFGAFMRFADNPQIEGLIHISELDYKLIENPKEVVKVDEPVKAKIVEIKEGRVSLSLKALKDDPWLKVEERYTTGETVSGTVFRFNPFGAFVNLAGDIQGLIHVSEFGSVDEMKKELEAGKAYNFTIEMLKPADHRLILKLKK